jgi:hypothetical protein
MKIKCKFLVLTALTAIALLSVGCSSSGMEANKKENTTVQANENQKQQISVSPKHKQLILEAKELAKQGKIVTTKDLQPIGSLTIIDIKKLWGNPDVEDSKSEFKFAEYKSKQTIFHYQTKEIVSMDTTDKRYKEITDAEIEQILGVPQMSGPEDGGSYTYEIGNYNLQFIFNCHGTCVDTGKPTPKVVRMSIFPKD